LVERGLTERSVRLRHLEYAGRGVAIETPDQNGGILRLANDGERREHRSAERSRQLSAVHGRPHVSRDVEPHVDGAQLSLGPKSRTTSSTTTANAKVEASSIVGGCSSRSTASMR